MKLRFEVNGDTIYALSLTNAPSNISNLIMPVFVITIRVLFCRYGLIMSGKTWSVNKEYIDCLCGYGTRLIQYVCGAQPNILSRLRTWRASLIIWDVFMPRAVLKVEVVVLL